MSRVFKQILLRRSLLQFSNAACIQNKHSWNIPKLSGFVENGAGNARYLHVGRVLQDQSALGIKKSESVESSSDQHTEELDSKIGKFGDLAKDVEAKKKILMILMEHEVARLEGKRVPSELKVEEMQELLSLYSFSSRIKYMGYLYVREQAKEANKRKKELKKKERESWLLEKQYIKPPEHIQYGIGHCTTLVRVRRKSVMRFFNQRLANAVLYGQKFIIDMDFDCFMRKQDCNNCGEQLLELYSANRKNRYPFDLHFCNVQHSSTTMRAFAKYMPNIYAPDNFITLTDMSYLDIYPKDKLVYVTPHAKEPMRSFDHDAVYIIGGLVDKCIREPVVMAKAKREGIRAVHLPYDEYLMWGRGNKSLPLNHVIEIMLEMKNTGDWNKAFKHVPQRKLVRSLDLFTEF